MLNKNFIYTAALSMSMAGLCGCSVPLCSEHGDESDERCQHMNTPVSVVDPPKFTIAQRHLAFTTTLEVTVAVTGNDQIDPTMQLTITQDNSTETGTVGKNGKVFLSLAKFHPGAVTFQLKYGGAIDPVIPGNLYVSPIYSDSADQVQVFNFSANKLNPIWAGITTTNHLSALTTNNSNRTFFTDFYTNSAQVDPGTQNFADNISAVNAPFPSSIYLGFTSVMSSSSTANLWICKNTNSCPVTVSIDNDQVHALAIDPQGTLFSVLYGASVSSYSASGSLQSSTSISTPLTGSATSSPSLIASGKMNGDDLPDLIVWDQAHNHINVLLQKPGPTGNSFVADSTLTTQLQNAIGTPQLVAMVSVDIDADGQDDLVYATGTQVAWITNQGPDSSGNPKFAAGNSFPIEGANVSSLSLGSLDGISKLLDLVVTQKTAHTVRVYSNKATY